AAVRRGGHGVRGSVFLEAGHAHARVLGRSAALPHVPGGRDGHGVGAGPPIRIRGGAAVLTESKRRPGLLPGAVSFSGHPAVSPSDRPSWDGGAARTAHGNTARIAGARP